MSATAAAEYQAPDELSCGFSVAVLYQV